MKVILGSKSPRRQQLLSEMGVNFEVITKETDETYSSDLAPHEVAIFIAENKAKALYDCTQSDETLLTADTIVCVDNHILGKPENAEEAKSMLNKLSGRKHKVITGVVVVKDGEFFKDYSVTNVYVRDLKPKEIDFYVENFKPFDKAGAYGIQEWFGAVAIEKIEGSYNNVVGLPTDLVYEMLNK